MAIGKGKRLDGGKMATLDVTAGHGIEYVIMREDDVLGVLDAAAQALSKTS